MRGGTKELRAYVLKEAGYEWIGDRIINGLSKTCCTNVEGNFFVSSYNDDAVKEIGDALVLISERSTEHLQR